MKEQAEMPNNELRSLVYAKFANITRFAEAIGWERKKASRIINHGQKPSAEDMERMADCLDVKDVYSFVHIFLPSLSTKWSPVYGGQVPDPLDPSTFL